MSMHEVEDFVELAVLSVVGSHYPIQEKRNLIHSLYEVESYSDCGFTKLRTVRQRVECFYTVKTEKPQLPDYSDKKDFYDAEWDGDPRESGGAYLASDDVVCIDSGTSVWEIMVEKGLITGEAAQPVSLIKVSTTAEKALRVMPKLDKHLREGYVHAVILAGVPLYLLPILWLRLLFHNIFAPRQKTLAGE